MNVSVVFGGVVATGLVVGIVGYGAVMRDNTPMALSSDAVEDEIVVPVSAPVEVPAPNDAQPDRVAPQAQATPSMPRAPEIRVPELGIVRVDAQGGALVAGTGPASVDVVLRLDGAVIASARTDAGGSFVTLFDLPASAEPQLLTLEARNPDGVVTRAVESVIVAPTLPGQPLIGSAPSADRETNRPLAGQGLAGDIAAPGTETAPNVSAPETTALARATPSDLPTPIGGLALTDRTRAPDPVSTAEAAVAGSAPTLDTAPDRTASDSTHIARTAPTALSVPGTSQAPTRAVEPETASSVTAAFPAAEGTAPQIAGLSNIKTTQPRAPRLIRTGPEGLSVQAPNTASQPEVTQDLGIDVISYDSVGDVQLAGRAEIDSELRIYLNNQPVQTVRVGPDGEWSAPLTDVASGVYTLRIDEVDRDGTVTARVETPFQRTAPEIAAQARRDGATAITVQTGYTLWALSEGYFGEGVQYVQIFEANRDTIRDPDLIYPGQVFRLPEAE